MTKYRTSWLLSAASLLMTAAATAQSLPCASVSPEVREYVRQRGACRDVKVATPRPKASPQSKATVADSPTPVQQFALPDVVGRSFADAAGALGNFKVERNETANAAPKGEVLAQQPAPTALARRGSTVILQVSDGSLAASDAVPVTAPVTAAAASSAAAPEAGITAALTAAPIPPQAPADPPTARDQLPTTLSTNVALIFGAGVLLGLFFGAVLMRERLLRRRVALGELAEPPVAQLPQSVVSRRVDQQIINQPPTTQPHGERQLVDQRPVGQPTVEQPPIGQENVDRQPAGSDAGGVSQPSAPFEIHFAARFVPVETTIALAPFAEVEETAADTSEDRHA